MCVFTVLFERYRPHSPLQKINDEGGSSLKYHYCIKHLKVLATDGSKTSCTVLVPLQQYTLDDEQDAICFAWLIILNHIPDSYKKQIIKNKHRSCEFIICKQFSAKVQSLSVPQLETRLSSVFYLRADTT